MKYFHQLTYKREFLRGSGEGRSKVQEIRTKVGYFR
jgi:hypothetical protein